MSTIREILATITTAATITDVPGDPTDATLSMAQAQVAAERVPFAALTAAIAEFFDGSEIDADEALAGPEAADAEVELRRIIAEHVRAARVRLAVPPPQVDWADSYALMQISAAAARRSADLRFVEILTSAASV